MSKRRLDRMESSLGPKEAVLRWMGEAHAFGSLPAYAASLIDQSATVQPFMALPAQIEKAVWESMRRERPGFVQEVTCDAISDTVFLLRLVLGLNVHVQGVLEHEGLRHAALYWWSRALDADGVKSADRSDWVRGAATLRGLLLGTERARASAEARYLDGHDCLFPELAVGWRDLCAAAESLGDGVAADGIPAAAAQDVERVVWMARADGLEAGGRLRAADEMASNVIARPDAP